MNGRTEGKIFFPPSLYKVRLGRKVSSLSDLTTYFTRFSEADQTALSKLKDDTIQETTELLTHGGYLTHRGEILIGLDSLPVKPVLLEKAETEGMICVSSGKKNFDLTTGSLPLEKNTKFTVIPPNTARRLVHKGRIFYQVGQGMRLTRIHQEFSGLYPRATERLQQLGHQTISPQAVVVLSLQSICDKGLGSVNIHEEITGHLAPWH